jgi:hypothetical protein
LPASELRDLFDDPSVIEGLSRLEASVSLGLLDLSPERAGVVKRLHRARIPVIAWLLLPKEQGYWFNINNAGEAEAFYDAFLTWTVENDLQWSGVGIDIEMDLREMEGLIQRKRSAPTLLLRRVLQKEKWARAQDKYAKLVSRMRGDGFRVDGYHFPFIVDERRAGSTLLRRLLGLVDVPVDREVLMLYTSLFGPQGVGILWSYAPEAESIGVGSTGGGVQIAGLGELKPMDWPALSRDLRLAHRCSDDIHIFSLEGCVSQGILPALAGLDWDEPETIPRRSARRVDLVRRVVQAVLWGSAHPLAVLGLFAFVLWLRRRISPRRR